MTRHCDNCDKVIPAGSNYISVTSIGVSDFKKLFGSDSLDFCKITCLSNYWSKKSDTQKEPKP